MVADKIFKFNPKTPVREWMAGKEEERSFLLMGQAYKSKTDTMIAEFGDYYLNGIGHS